MENKNKVVVNGSTKEILKLLKKGGLVVQVGESKIDEVKSVFDNKAYGGTRMKKWKIPVTWEVCGYVYVDADTLVEAMETARDDEGVIPLPIESDYVDGSWRLSETDENFVREMYNDNQQDDEGEN